MNKKRILIVDDSYDNRLLLKVLLESKGYATDCTSNGHEALVLLNTTKELPQTILLDLGMPVMDGITFRNIQKKDPRLKDIPVVIMSGEEDVADTRAKTDSDVLQKPLSVKTVMEALKRNSNS